MTSSEFPFKPGARVWGYGRDSGGIHQQESVPQQRRVIESLCQEHGVILVHFFGDEARIGSTTVGRDALEDLLYLAKQQPQPVDGIIFWSFARLARDQLDSQFTKIELRRRGYILYSMLDDIPSGEFAPVIEALVDWKNERFLQDLSREVRRGLADLAKQGYAPGGFPPRGYLANKVQIGVKRDGQPHIVSRWVPDPELGSRVTRAWEMKAAGASYLAIHEATHIMGTVGSYSTLFRNKTYLGIRKCGDLEIENAHEPLVSRELWDAVQATLRERPKKGEQWPEGKQHPMRSNTPFLLSGLAVCAECGAAMVSGQDNVSNGRNSPWPYYLCGRKKREGWQTCPSGKIGAREPEAAVLQAVTERVLTPDFISALVAEVNALVDRHTPTMRLQAEETQRQLAGLDDAIRNLLDLVEQFGAASAGPRLAEREAERAQLNDRLQQLVRQQEAYQATISLEMVRGMLTEMHGTLTDGSLGAKRAMLSKVVHKVVMSATGAELVYTFPL
jgi:DNA invertase Pin-like site-specific DNA recombinase